MPVDGAQTVANSPSERVIEAVAAHKGFDAEALPPLYERIDCDALDDLFPSRTEGTDGRVGRGTFEYAGLNVTVTSDGAVDLE